MNKCSLHWFILSLASLLLGCSDPVPSSPKGSAGTIDGNGGDLVLCVGDQSSDFNGIYTLDYLVTYAKPNSPSMPNLVEVSSWAESSTRILRRLQLIDPKLFESFKDFVSYVGISDQSKPRHWLPRALLDIKDEFLISTVPEACRLKKAGSQGEEFPHILQGVRRDVLSTGSIRYLYDPLLFEDTSVAIGDYRATVNLAKDKPLQLSFLLVHEWLWDHMNSQEISDRKEFVENLRNLNRFIHSTDFDQKSLEEIQATFKALRFHRSSAAITAKMPILHSNVFVNSNSSTKILLGNLAHGRYVVRFKLPTHAANMRMYIRMNEPPVVQTSGDGLSDSYDSGSVTEQGEVSAYFQSTGGPVYALIVSEQDYGYVNITVDKYDQSSPDAIQGEWHKVYPKLVENDPLLKEMTLRLFLVEVRAAIHPERNFACFMDQTLRFLYCRFGNSMIVDKVKQHREVRAVEALSVPPRRSQIFE